MSEIVTREEFETAMSDLRRLILANSPKRIKVNAISRSQIIADHGRAKYDWGVRKGLLTPMQTPGKRKNARVDIDLNEYKRFVAILKH